MSSDVRSSPAASQGSVATASRKAASHRAPTAASVEPGPGRAMSVVIIVLTTAAAAVWSLVALDQLSSSIAAESVLHVNRARKTFDLTRLRTVDSLRAQSRVMVEDPRLKSTLATDGVDEITVADILGDLEKLRGAGFLLVLTPEGHVFAQAGADELRGLDLSGSSAVKKAQGTLDAVTGSWVIGGKIMDLSIMPVRFGASPIAYLVVGQAIDQAMLNAVADQTGVAIATAIGQTVLLSAPASDNLKAVFSTVVGQLDSAQSRMFEIHGESYAAASSELEDAGQSRPRLIAVQSLAQPNASFATLKWMIFVPPFLVIIAVLFALTANRRIVIARQ